MEDSVVLVASWICFFKSAKMLLNVIPSEKSKRKLYLASKRLVATIVATGNTAFKTENLQKVKNTTAEHRP